MDLGRLIRFIKEKEMNVDDVKNYVAELRRQAKRGATEGKLIKATKAEKETLTIGQGELGERQRILLSIAERSGAAELQPGDRGGLLVHLTGKGSPRAAHEAIQTAKNRSWDSYKSIEKYSSSGEICRRRQILDHFGDDEPGRPTGRCCDVCDPDEALEKAMSGRAPGRAVSASRGRSSGAGGGAGSNGIRRSSVSGNGRGSQTTLLDATGETDADPVDEQEFERLRAWRYERAEGKPVYTIASNAVLEQILRVRPTNEDELFGIKGVGPAFCEKHGDSLLNTLSSFS
jgi:superfamily II DNA helicase RecQ